MKKHEMIEAGVVVGGIVLLWLVLHHGSSDASVMPASTGGGGLPRLSAPAGNDMLTYNYPDSAPVTIGGLTYKGGAPSVVNGPVGIELGAPNVNSDRTDNSVHAIFGGNTSSSCGCCTISPNQDVFLTPQEQADTIAPFVVPYPVETNPYGGMELDGLPPGSVLMSDGTVIEYGAAGEFGNLTAAEIPYYGTQGVRDVIIPGIV